MTGMWTRLIENPRVERMVLLAVLALMVAGLVTTAARW